MVSATYTYKCRECKKHFYALLKTNLCEKCKMLLKKKMKSIR